MPTVGQQLDSSSTTLCGQYNGSLKASAMGRVVCPLNIPLFRYVIMQGSLSQADAICLAEVMVYSGEFVPMILLSKGCNAT